jgi:CelD/BcsL family acetyltransferase involved in cellulose biosynthesis
MNVAFQTDFADAQVFKSDTLVATPQIARIDVYDNLEAAEPAWMQLATANALMTPYQRFEWVMLWHRHVTSTYGMTPLIIVPRERTNAPLFILPLMLRRAGITTIAGFFGGRHANLNTGLWRADVAATITAQELSKILRDVAARHNIDVYKLASQPDQLPNAIRNPMAMLPHQAAPDDVFVLTLDGKPGPEALKTCLTGTMRGRLRTKERKLQALPGYRFFRAETPDEVNRVFEAFVAQKAAHLTNQGISNVFDDPEAAAFLRSACHQGLGEGRPVIELFALEGGGEVIAVFGGVNDGRRMSCMFNSYTLGEASRWSPGLILLTNLISYCADNKITYFDLGVGYSFYKTLFCKEYENVFDTIIGTTMTGRATAIALRLARSAKRELKANPALWGRFMSLRQMVKP